MAKVAPQMNMFAVGMQMKVLGTYGIVPHGNAASGNFRFCV